MNKNMIRKYGYLIFMIPFLLFSTVFMGCKTAESDQTTEQDKTIESDQTAEPNKTDESDQTDKVPQDITVASSSDTDVLTLDYADIKKVTDIFNVDNQKNINVQVEALKSKDDYNAENMLFIYNPYCTNNTSLYVYFKTEEASSVSYTIHVDNDEIPDFTRSLYNKSGDYAFTHEYQILGLIPDVENTITFNIITESGDTITKELFYTAPPKQGPEELILEVIDGVSKQELSDGLYAILGNDSDDQDYMLYYDNAGVLRGEIPISGYRSHRLLFDDEYVYFSISAYRIVQMDRLGQLVTIYSLYNQYSLHHDYVFDDDGNLLVLATNVKEDRVEDIIIKIDVKTSEVTEILDSINLFPTVYEIAPGLTSAGDWDPLHYNTIQWLGNDSIIVSARETSAIIKINNIYDEPVTEYIISDEAFWTGTGYEDLLYTKVGDFKIQLGQHSVTYLEDETLLEGQYFLYLYHNNVAHMPSRVDFDWSIFEETGEYSSYYLYLIDENERTFELKEQLKLPYSGFVSSVQLLDGNLIYDSGMAGEFGEYDSDRQLIRAYKMILNKSYIYRVYKYDFDGFYFRSY